MKRLTDYEIVEVRETRMVLKTSSGEKGAIKIGGGRAEKTESDKESKKSEPKVEKKRRRGSRRRKAREEESGEESSEEETSEVDQEEKTVSEGAPATVSPSLTSLLPPPKALIRETINRYKEDDLFKEAFYTSREEEDDDDEEPMSFEDSVFTRSRELTSIAAACTTMLSILLLMRAL